IVAHEKVSLQQLPVNSALTNVPQRVVTAGLLELNRSPQTGLIQKIHAETNVVSEEIAHSKTNITIKRLSAEVVDLNFSAVTNQIESAVADKNVFVENIVQANGVEKKSEAMGGHAEYHAASDNIELTNSPSALVDGHFIRDAQFFRWNLKTGIYSALKGVGSPVNPTNSLRDLIKP
ncbi:MAG: hypothetical protein ABJC04_08450, partial [Verrucomicrobiota bacterium]